MTTGMFEAAGKKQHAQYFRKVALRKKLLPRKHEGAAYVPFIGDGDLAAELYSGYKIFGADLDPARVLTASERLPGSKVIVYDCDRWGFGKLDEIFTLGDFDPYYNPYASFRSWWENTKKADQVTVFFTDATRPAVVRYGKFITPQGPTIHIESIKERRKIYNFYLKRYILPWFVEYIKPYKLMKKSFYTRGHMLYWGAIIRK